MGGSGRDKEVAFESLPRGQKTSYTEQLSFRMVRLLGVGPRLAESPPDSLATGGLIRPQPHPVPLHFTLPPAPLVCPPRRR
jgi:hypothetical protein